MTDTHYAISRIERETGISKDVLRMWERRYGFPMPIRSENGERLYAMSELERLLLIKRLMDLGHRPGRLMKVTNEQLLQMLASPVAPIASPTTHEVALLLKLLQKHDIQALERRLAYWMLRYGYEALITDLLPHFLKVVGEAWQTNQLMIHDEHLLIEILQNLLRRTNATINIDEQAPRVLLTTFPEEQHGMGLLMLEALFRLEGATTINLGLQTPVDNIVAAAKAYQIDAVCLSCSEAMSVNDIYQYLVELCRDLPPTVEIWFGGEGVKHIQLTDFPYVKLKGLKNLAPQVVQWRSRVAK